MENASKALLISASILIATLLIGFGMRIFNQSAEPVNEFGGTMDATAIATFNSKFLKYGGTQNGGRVKSLANEVISHNASAARKVSFKGSTEANGIISAISSVNSMSTYTVTITDSNGDGYIDTISF